MEVFELNGDIHLMMMKPVGDDVIDRLLGVRFGTQSWPADEVIPVRAGGWYGAKAWVPSDCPYFEHLPPVCLSRFAQEHLGPLLHGAGYYADTDLDVGGLYRMFFVTHRVHAFDLDRSMVTRASDGNVAQVFRFELNANAIGDSHIFKLNDRIGSKFVTDTFVAVVEQAGLVGFEFKKIWSSDHGSVDLNVPGPGLEKYPGQQKAQTRAKQAAALKIIRQRSQGSAP